MADATQHVLSLVGKHAPEDGRGTLVDEDVWRWARYFTWFVSANGYVSTRTGGRTITLHRIVAGTPHGFDTDHANRDRLDNRRANLRSVTRQQNVWNTGPRRDGHSRFKGVTFHRAAQKWAARIYVDTCFDAHLGLHSTEEAAARAYDHAARLLFNGFGWLNFPGERVECLSSKIVANLERFLAQRLVR